MKTVILCGGSGTRLWPISRKTTPKQFAPLLGDQSLYQKTVQRNLGLSEEILIIVNEKQFPICKKQQAPDISINYLLEPVGRNTAPAIALACLQVNPQDILMVVPSDHLIGNLKAYNDSIMLAKQFAEEGNLVTFGIQAKYPETGYGYIEYNQNDVVAFKEKPDLSTATRYVESGNYYWNSGMFCFKASSYLEELEKNAPLILSKVKEVYAQKTQNGNVYNFDFDLMMQIPDDSIDYAVMEKSDKVKVVPTHFDWSDMGSFDSLYEELEKNENGNNINNQYINYQSRNNLVLTDKKVVATFNVEDLIIVDTEDALLVGHRSQSQSVKNIVDILKKSHPSLLE